MSSSGGTPNTSTSSPANSRVQDGLTTTLATVRTPADGIAESSALVVEADMTGWSGSSRSRLLTGSDGSNQSPSLTGVMRVISEQYVLAPGPSTWGRVTALNTDTSDGQSAIPVTPSYFDGALWPRARSASAANLGAQSSIGSALATRPGDWSQTHAPAANVQATSTRAAIAGTVHVCTSISASLVAGAVAPGVVNVLVVLRDGASGVGAIKWSEQVAIQAIAGDKDNLLPPGLAIVGTAGNAMTLEFAAAGGANTTEVLSITGYDAA